ncbi:hypothetical protein [Paratissierella segnis]|uniref:Uncharacterized protein n=1 Tax=Paratissierella segnis TaxID=2763679 RepID=A0A926ERE7_9FIRM|nr:hypothetical protein [Paratissierella segnis]MBC8588348.1 hypothetical protein [Paratissierella segnis]
MFYFLMTLGIVLIALGVYKEKNNIKTDEKYGKVALNDLYHLNQRIEAIEKILFFPDSDEFGDDTYKSIEKSIEKSLKEEPQSIPQNSLEKYERILKYEEDNYSLEEICNLLDMKKGEVLLLKNLYKNYKT